MSQINNRKRNINKRRDDLAMAATLAFAAEKSARVAGKYQAASDFCQRGNRALAAAAATYR